jgi:chorismate lyase
MTAALPRINAIAPPKAWHGLDLIWQSNLGLVQSGLPHDQLSPTWQMLLLGDGSPTRILQVLTGQPTVVDLVDMSAIGFSSDHAPEVLEQVPGPRLRRQVWLHNGEQRLAYATSWWEMSHVDEYLQNRSLPIWTSLGKLKTELYREVLGLHYGNSPALEIAFNQKGPFWGRYYLFWHNGAPLTLIYEVFSPSLQKYLGPMVMATSL